MSEASEPPFQQIAIVGLGLIGGSIALAVRQRWPASRVIAVDRQPVLAHAISTGAIDSMYDSVAAIPSADLVVLAAPVRQNIELLGEIGRSLTTPAVVTDVGGTKQSIVSAAQALPDTVTFVGGHPLGGAERGGFGFARPDLFVGRPWIFTPDGPRSKDAVERLSRFVTRLGARPATITAEEHDQVMAFLSHLPQLAVTALMDAVGGAVPGDRLSLAGQGLVDTTRLASSPASVWRDICATNTDAIGGALDQFIARLQEMRAALQQGDTIDRFFDEAARTRAELMKGRE
jgi:prephenate dehydrogenase